ncbi:hypothetical protein DPMN_097482 [Dreissena polymorpha]|uniref:BPTI/Kunitz inhibitor domain-containing protein n=1 Tax=Dreissena polymorpha TaxID=45954 RepID=A0A9D4LDD0_DREPO|nr:hypothetical protein DPMN_097482 [Dreissena polymorpha]
MNALPVIVLLLFGTVKVMSEIDPEKNVCEMPMLVGPCRAYIPRYFFDQKAGTCQKFIYGGCGSNGNNFKTEEACMASCAP